MPSSPSSSAASKKIIRQGLRQQRKAIAPAQRAQFARQAARRGLPRLQAKFTLRGLRVGVYWPLPDEADPRPLMRQLFKQGVKLYLPRIHRHAPLWFVPWQPHCRLRAGRLGIAEPGVARGHRRATHLDVLILPVLGYTNDGLRMGQGGGFYDRALAFRHTQPARPPFLLGLAFACGRRDALPHDPWDVPLDAILNECAWHTCRPNLARTLR